MGQKKICIKNPTPSSGPSSSKPSSSTQRPPAAKKTPTKKPAKQPATSPKAKLQPAHKKQKVTHKKADVASSSKAPTKSTSSTKRKERLASNSFGAHRYVDWELIRSYGLEAEIKELLSVGPWEALFAIRTPAYYDITLEVLSTLELNDKDYSKGVNAQLTFTAYGKHHTVPLKNFCVYMGLYTEEEIKTPEFTQLSNNWPLGATQVNYWKQICGVDMNYYPSKSKASSIQNVRLRVVHWMLANTIGARKSSTGVVNNFELFFLHSIATRYKINVGVELAHYLYRQASDPRAKGIYCGGYITKLLQGMNVFQEPASGSRSVLISKVTDGPFAGWGLEKLVQTPKRIYSTPPRPVPIPSPGASTSQASTDVLKRIDKLENDLTTERKKSKKFRAFAVKMLLRLGRCINPPPKDLPSYESSSSESEDSSSESDDSTPAASKPPAPAAAKKTAQPSSSKAPSKESSSESEEVDDEDDDEEDAEEEEDAVDENDDDEDADDKDK